MKKTLFALMLIPILVFGQNYTSYFTGNSGNVTTNPQGGICLMGGAGEHDAAMTWFLERASGGDVLVLRTTGSNGYNDYLYNQLGVSVNSVETIVCHNAAASYEPYVQQQINEAEAIWIAGGDQWDYISFWRDTPVDSLINKGIIERQIVIGGISAGMAIQGGYYFTAENGTISSAAALSNPYAFNATVSDQPFIQNDVLFNVITDTHYDNPDRKGRHISFIGRIMEETAGVAKGIACDEYNAVCIQPDGLCKLYGDPAYDDNIYFIQPNCELSDMTPESCMAGQPLDWNRGNAAVRVYHATGDLTGSQTFDLSDWKTGSGGQWETWYVSNGVLYELPGDPVTCSFSQLEWMEDQLLILTNPVISGELKLNNAEIQELILTDLSGREHSIPVDEGHANLSGVAKGSYICTLIWKNGVYTYRIEVL